METGPDLRLDGFGAAWQMAEAGSDAFATANQCLKYLDDRDYSWATVRARGSDWLVFCRYLQLVIKASANTATAQALLGRKIQ